MGYTAWSAGLALSGQSLSSPALTQWIAIAAGPLALFGLLWLVFGRTRRKEAEAFTRSVVSMRQEAGALQDVLAALCARTGVLLVQLAAHAAELAALTGKDVRYSPHLKSYDRSAPSHAAAESGQQHQTTFVNFARLNAFV